MKDDQEVVARTVRALRAILARAALALDEQQELPLTYPTSGDPSPDGPSEFDALHEMTLRSIAKDARRIKKPAAPPGAGPP